MWPSLPHLRRHKDHVKTQFFIKTYILLYVTIKIGRVLIVTHCAGPCFFYYNFFINYYKLRINSSVEKFELDVPQNIGFGDLYVGGHGFCPFATSSKLYLFRVVRKVLSHLNHNLVLSGLASLFLLVLNSCFFASKATPLTANRGLL
jgi:hypothetical protein